MKRKGILKDLPPRKRRETDGTVDSGSQGLYTEETVTEKLRRYYALEKSHSESGDDMDEVDDEDWDEMAERQAKLFEEYYRLARELSAAGVDFQNLPPNRVLFSDFRKLQMLRDQWRNSDCGKLQEGMTRIEDALRRLGINTDSDWAQTSTEPTRVAHPRRVQFRNQPDILIYNTEKTPSKSPKRRHSTDEEREERKQEIAAALAEIEDRSEPHRLGGGWSTLRWSGGWQPSSAY